MDTTCDICGIDGKYKCPRCFIHYCSMSCCREHKKGTCEDKNPHTKIQDDKENGKNEKEVRGGIPKEKLEQLEQDADIQNLLANKHLRDLLLTIDKAEKAEQIMHEAMQEPIFVEFADACLKVVDPMTEDKD